MSTDRVTRFPLFRHIRLFPSFSFSFSLPANDETEKLNLARAVASWSVGVRHVAYRACCSIRWATTGEAEWFVYRHRGIFRASSRRGLEESRTRHSDLLRRRLGRGAHINGTTLTPCRPVLRVRCSHVLSTRCRSISVLFLFFSASSLETRKRSRFLPRTSRRNSATMSTSILVRICGPKLLRAAMTEQKSWIAVSRCLRFVETKIIRMDRSLDL